MTDRSLAAIDIDHDRAVAVIDIDGVLADVRHRLHFVRRRPKDWEAFFAVASADPVLEEGRAVVQQLAEEHDLVFLSGRPERLRDETLGWLCAAGLPGGDLMLRPAGDRRPARLLKVELLHDLARARQVAIVVDDDPAVCAAVEAAGFPVFRATWMTELADNADEQALSDAQQCDGRT